MSKYTITIFSDNTPGVLYRISGLFLRQKLNIESLTVSEVEQKKSIKIYNRCKYRFSTRRKDCQTTV